MLATCRSARKLDGGRQARLTQRACEGKRARRGLRAPRLQAEIRCQERAAPRTLGWNGRSGVAGLVRGELAAHVLHADADRLVDAVREEVVALRLIGLPLHRQGLLA